MAALKPKGEAEQILQLSVASQCLLLPRLGDNLAEQLSLTFVAAGGGSGAVIAGLGMWELIPAQRLHPWVLQRRAGLCL